MKVQNLWLNLFSTHLLPHIETAVTPQNVTAVSFFFPSLVIFDLYFFPVIRI